MLATTVQSLLPARLSHVMVEVSSELLTPQVSW